MSNQSVLTKNENGIDIHVVGLGIMSIKHITVEATEALHDSKHVFYIDNGFGVEQYLRKLCPKVTSLADCYVSGKSRRVAYNTMAARVLNSALEEAPVCFASYGHPSVLVYPTYLIKSFGELLDLNVKVYPAISALDTILIDMGIDPGFHGLQMFDATDLLARERPLQNDVPCLIWQADVTGIVEYSVKHDLRQNLDTLEKHLSNFYPSDHSLTLISSATFPLLDPVKISFPLRDLAATIIRSNIGGSLFIPPVAPRPVKDSDFVRMMTKKSIKTN